MRHENIAAALVALAVLLFAQGKPQAAEKRLGKIAATAPTAKNNSTTAAPFTLGSGTKLSVQCDAIVYVAVTQDAAYLATADDVKLAADQLFPTSTPKGTGTPAYVSILPVSGSATCRVYVRAGDEV